MNRISLVLVAVLLAGTALAQTAPAPGTGNASPSAQQPAQQDIPVAPGASRTVPRGEDTGQQAPGVPVAGQQPQQGADEHALPVNTPIVAELTKAIDVKKAKEGDPVTARSLQDVLREGSVVIPRGARLVGHVAQAQRASKGNDQSAIGIAWDRVETRGGQQFPLHADIQALGPRMEMAENPAMTIGNRGQNEPMGAPTPGAPPMGGPPMGNPGGTAGTANPGGSGVPSGGEAPDIGGVASPTDMPRTGQRGGTPPLSAHSTGVQGMPGITLTPQSDPRRGSLIRDARGNLRLESGTQLVLRVVSQ